MKRIRILTAFALLIPIVPHPPLKAQFASGVEGVVLEVVLKSGAKLTANFFVEDSAGRRPNATPHFRFIAQSGVVRRRRKNMRC